MSEKKNIDRLFQEKFKDFEVEPSEKVWKNIESKLKEKKENRKVIPFWIKLSGIAAALLIGFFTTDSLLNSKKDNNQNVVIQDKNPENKELNSIKNKEIITSSEVSNTGIEKKSLPNSLNKAKIQSEISTTKNKENTNWNSSDNAVTQSDVSDVENRKSKKLNSSSKMINRNSSVTGKKFKSKNILNTDLGVPNNTLVSQDSENSSRKNSKKKSVKNKKEDGLIVGNSKLDVTNELEINQNESTPGLVNQSLTENNIDNKNQVGIANVTDSDSDKKIDSTAIAAVVPNVLEELLKEKEKKIVVTKEPKLKKWQVSSNVASIYYNSAANGSPLDSLFKNNNKEYKTNLAYGLGVKYALNTKLSVRTGVNAVALEYNTNDVVFYQNKNAVSIKHIVNNIQGSLIQIENKNSSASPEISPNDMTVSKFDGNLNQKTGYIEIPLELSYKIVDKKFGVEIIGGLSTLYLNENQVSLVSSGMEMKIGEADNLNAMHFSTNVGLGFKYNFLKSFQANFEPMFKYQLNTYSNDAGNFKPYFFGLYTGVSYRF